MDTITFVFYLGVILLLAALGMSIVMDRLEDSLHRRYEATTKSAGLYEDPELLFEREQAREDLRALKNFGPTGGLIIRWLLYVGFLLVIVAMLAKGLLPT